LRIKLVEQNLLALAVSNAVFPVVNIISTVMIAELDHIYNIPIDCEGKEYVPAILLSVNKMVAVAGDI